jgi:hypothetical protein
VRLIPPLLVSLLLAFLLARSGIGVNLFTVAVVAALAYGVHAAGRLMLQTLIDTPGERLSPAPAAWTLGLTATSYAVYALMVLLPLTAAVAAGVVLAIVIAAEIALLRRNRGAPNDWRALIGFALCVGLTAAWCAGPAGAYETLRTQGVLPVWSDYFFHGGLLSQFGDSRAFGRGSIYIADHPASFYHFASYALPAALVGALDQPALAFATAAWLPLGFLAMLAGAYTLGARLAGAAGGIAALVAVAMLPDASNYGLHNGYFSFHWNLMAHPGATYALGAAFLSLAFLDRWSVERSRAALLVSALLAASAFLFRAHIFLLFLPAWVATAALCSARDTRGRRLTAWLMVAGLGAGAAAASLAVAHLADSGYWRFGERALHEFLIRVHMGVEPTAYPDAYADFVTFESTGYALTLGVGLVVLAALGAFVLLLPAALLLARERGALRPIDAFCGFLFFTWLMLVLFAPQPWHGDPTDLIHRPLVLLYACFAIWTFCLVLRVLSWKVWPGLLGVALLALPAVVASADGMARPKFAWGEKDIKTRVPPGLVAAAAFLRREAAVGDIFAVAGLTADYATFDLSTQLCALSGMPAYLSRPYVEMPKDAPRKRVAAARLAALQQIDQHTDYGAATRSLRALKVQWYVVAGERGPLWDPGGGRAAFKAGTVALYRTP